uniref:DNA-3-methyladenine glycosylase I n=1 Tax=Mesonia mobilis TaxID=369791 RepID=UPI0024BB4752
TSFPEIRLFCEINSIFENINWRHKFEIFEVDVLLEDYKIALEYDGWFYHVNSLSKDLKKRGFKFVGSTVIYAHMQATGMVNDHEVSCFRYEEVKKL